MKEGSKEICYKKIYHINDDCYNLVFVEQKINNEFPDCPMRAVFEYNSTDRFEMIEYQIIKSENNKVQRNIYFYNKIFVWRFGKRRRNHYLSCIY